MPIPSSNVGCFSEKQLYLWLTAYAQIQPARALLPILCLQHMVALLRPHHQNMLCLLSVHGIMVLCVGHEPHNHSGQSARHTLATASCDTSQNRVSLSSHQCTRRSRRHQCRLQCQSHVNIKSCAHSECQWHCLFSYLLYVWRVRLWSHLLVQAAPLLVAYWPVFLTWMWRQCSWQKYRQLVLHQKQNEHRTSKKLMPFSLIIWYTSRSPDLKCCNSSRRAWMIICDDSPWPAAIVAA